MADIVYRGVGPRIAYERRIARLSQADLARTAGVSLGTVRKVERGERGVSGAVLEAIAGALGIDPTRLLPERERPDDRVHQAMPGLSAVLASYEEPDDGPCRELSSLREAASTVVGHRLGAQYTRIARSVPGLLAEVCRALSSAAPGVRPEMARLLVDTCRAADAVAFKHGARDLSARLLDLMRWAGSQAGDPFVEAAVAYVRAELHFGAGTYAVGLRSLERALDRAPRTASVAALAARGALHMRAAVLAGRAGDHDAADVHLDDARDLGDRVQEGVYQGTAFGPHSVRVHEVSVAVSLGGSHVGRALRLAREWKPPMDLPAERRSGFYIELGRAQLWSGQPDAAFESLKMARRIAPQHAREHRWVREDAATLRRLKRADADSLSSFAEWCHAGTVA
ncbi:Helix-turn-helix domain-containing protein [Streptomyces sp. 2112.3]|uniref:helix-turn-helix domain-containing protein n=1 Tax=Streptomyces sp. 2112.3 TaxID=1881023 RepID=UPI0008943E2E|nr:helix-turn-helix transcriptional regulator [Streptomyces sp. 2112.3]SED95721.1 Helix-turn-helix domain-containing protein [Streptomyces sp. 2112.3]